MFTGNILVNTNKQECLNLLQSHIVVDISGDNDPQINNVFVKASVLLPPYQASMFMIDGDMMNFNMVYNNYLSSETPYQFLLLLLKGIATDRKYIFYLTKDELEMGYCQVLLNYLNIITNNNNPLDITKLLYINNQLSTDEFILFCRYILHATNGIIVLNQPIIRRFIFETKPYLGLNPSMFDMEKYLMDIINNKMETNIILENPMKGIY